LVRPPFTPIRILAVSQHHQIRIARL
jgi:hypothetical protein